MNDRILIDNFKIKSQSTGVITNITQEYVYIANYPPWSNGQKPSGTLDKRLFSEFDINNMRVGSKVADVYWCCDIDGKGTENKRIAVILIR